MCGIVGLFCKSPELEPKLGSQLAAMLLQLGDRGPDSAGFAVYGGGKAGFSKLTLRDETRDIEAMEFNVSVRFIKLVRITKPGAT